MASRMPTSSGEGRPLQCPRGSGVWEQQVTQTHCPVEVTTCIRVYEIASRLGDMHESTGTIFELKELPRDSLEHYVRHVLCRIRAPCSVLFCATVLLSRCGVRANRRTAHLLLLTAIMVAHKHQSDFCHKNSDYARVGKVPLGFINRLECAFLVLLDFRLCVTQRDVDVLLEELGTLREDADLQAFYSEHREKHSTYLREQQLSPSLSLQTDIGNVCSSAGLSTAASVSPSVTPSSTTWSSAASSGWAPQPPSLPHPAGGRPSRASASSAGLASGPAGGRGGLPRARQASLPSSAARIAPSSG